MPARLSLIPLLAAAVLASNGAYAMGFGRAPSSLVLGSPLNFPIQLRLESDESIEPECVSAEVQFGDRRLQPFNVQVRVEPGADSSERILRVVSLLAVDEPVVTVSVTAGCVTKVSRRVTVLADPPLGQVAAAPQALPLAETVPTGGAPVPAPAATSPVPTTVAPAATTTTAQPAPAAAPSPTAEPRPRIPKPPARDRATSTKQSTAGATGAQARARQLAAARPAPRTSGLPADKPTGGRLRLETPDLATASPAAAAASAAADALAAALRAASAAESSASSATLRVRQLESQLDKVLAESRQQTEQMQALRQQIGNRDLLPWLGALAAILAAACAWLALQVRRLNSAQESRWWAEAAAQARSDAQPTAHEEPQDAAAPVRRTATVPPSDAPVAIVDTGPVSQPSTLAAPITVAAPVSVNQAAATAPLPREVSVEELIDLEQQAEFFIVLGQDDSAIDLLVSHIRGTGGTSPLPYLKLLEIHRRRDETEAYERTRARFNHRFNAYAPEWHVDMQQGRWLEDYPQVLQRLQRVWPKPLDAMAMLETLLFRSDGGELFELPAYRDVLMLYALARDLIDREHGGAPGPAVDVLLPLGEFTNFEATTPRPHLSLDLAAQGGLERRPPADPPTMSIDLDLSEPELPTRDVTAPGAFLDSNYSDSDFIDIDRPVGRAPRKPGH